MSPAMTVALLAAVVDLAVAAVFFALSRAPGWRSSLVFGFIAASASVYAMNTFVASTPGLPEVVRQLASCAGFAVAALHCALWIVFARSSLETGGTALSPLDRVVVKGLAGIAALALVPGLLVGFAIDTIEVPQLGVTYWNTRLTSLGLVAGGAMVVSLMLPISTFVSRARRGERGARTIVGGFVILTVTALNEVLVVSGAYEFLFLLDAGFGAMLVGIAAVSVRRVVRDSTALARLSNQLAGDALASQAERDEAREALVDAERIGHEINNPLAYVRHSLREVTQHFDTTEVPSAVREALADATEGAARIDRAVRQLRGLEGTTSDSLRPVPASAVTPAAVRQAPRLLLVDDDERLCRAIARMLRGYDVTTASNGQVALERLAERSDFDGIVCDIAMPEMDGIELALEVAKRWPALRARMLFLTGGAPGSAGFLARSDVRWLRKPFHPEALQRGLDELGVPPPSGALGPQRPDGSS